MKFSRTVSCILGLALVAWAGAGCKKKDAGASGIAAEQVPATVETAFRSAPEEVRQQAAEAVTAIQSQNDGAAFVQFQTLSSRPDLTAEQRQAAFDSWMVANLRLQQSAAGGNNAAKELLEKYRASK